MLKGQVRACSGAGDRCGMDCEGEDCIDSFVGELRHTGWAVCSEACEVGEHGGLEGVTGADGVAYWQRGICWALP